MSKIFTNLHPVTNLYKKMSAKSEVVTQMLYGDSFLIIEKTKKWLKIKIIEDNYSGYIKNRNFSSFIKPMFTALYKFSNNFEVSALFKSFALTVFFTICL